MNQWPNNSLRQRCVFWRKMHRLVWKRGSGCGGGVLASGRNHLTQGQWEGQLSKGMGRVRSSNPGKNSERHFKERKDQVPRPGGVLRRKMHFISFCCLDAKSCPTLSDPMCRHLQAPLSVGFSSQEHCSGLSGPPPGDFPGPGVEPASLMSHALAGRFFTSATREAIYIFNCLYFEIRRSIF